ncbi:unnamed protein product, partial [Durusdinium trenchii]
MAQRRRGRRGSRLLLGLVGVLGAMRLMAERMEVGFAGWRMDQMGLGPGGLPSLRRRAGGSLVPHAVTAKTVAVSPEDRDAAFMERLRCLAREALSWAWLTPQQRLVWAAAIELDAVPLQELPPWFWERQNVTLRHPGRDAEVEGKHSAQVIIDQHFPKKHRAKTTRPTFKPYSTALFKSDRHCLGTSSNSRSLKNSSNLLLCMSRFLPGLVVYLVYTPYRPGS